MVLVCWCMLGGGVGRFSENGRVSFIAHVYLFSAVSLGRSVSAVSLFMMFV